MTLGQSTLEEREGDGGERKISLEEVAKHGTREDAWICIGEHVYDITEFIPKHPGGFLIDQGLGRDASVIFYTSHPLKVHGMLDKYRIGRVERPAGHFAYNWNSPFYRTVRGRVEEHFASRGARHRDSMYIYATALYTVFMFFFFYYLTHISGYIFLAPICGWFMSQLGVSIMHDGNHGAFSKRPWVNAVAGSVMDILGGSSLVWKHQHNIGHHQFTNSVVDDPDCSTGWPILRFNKTQRWVWFHQFQHIYMWVLYGVHSYKWYFMDMWNVYEGRYRQVQMYKPQKWELAVTIAGKSFVFCLQFLFPLLYNIYYHGLVFGAVRWFVAFMMIVTTTSYCFSFQFVINHLVDGCEFPELQEPADTADAAAKKTVHNTDDWAELQVMTSANYYPGSRLWTFISGGLCHQVEHHLFPTYAHCHYPRIIAPIVKEACEEFGVPYITYPTWWTAIKHHFYHMRNMGIRPKYE